MVAFDWLMGDDIFFNNAMFARGYFGKMPWLVIFLNNTMFARGYF